MPNSNPWIAAALTGIAGASKGMADERKVRRDASRKMREADHQTRMGMMDATYDSMLRKEEDQAKHTQNMERDAARAKTAERQRPTYNQRLLNRVQEAQAKAEAAKEEEAKLKKLQSAQEQKDKSIREAQIIMEGWLSRYNSGQATADEVADAANKADILRDTDLWRRLDLDKFVTGNPPKPRSVSREGDMGVDDILAQGNRIDELRESGRVPESSNLFMDPKSRIGESGVAKGIRGAMGIHGDPELESIAQ